MRNERYHYTSSLQPGRWYVIRLGLSEQGHDICWSFPGVNARIVNCENYAEAKATAERYAAEHGGYAECGGMPPVEVK